MAEIERLNVEISNLEAALQGAERRCHHQDQIHQDKMNKLTEDMTSLEREYRQRSEDYKRRTAEKLREVEDDYRRRMEEMKEDFRRKMEIAERKVIEENIIVSASRTVTPVIKDRIIINFKIIFSLENLFKLFLFLTIFKFM